MTGYSYRRPVVSSQSLGEVDVIGATIIDALLDLGLAESIERNSHQRYHFTLEHRRMQFGSSGQAARHSASDGVDE